MPSIGIYEGLGNSSEPSSRRSLSPRAEEGSEEKAEAECYEEGLKEKQETNTCSYELARLVFRFVIIFLVFPLLSFVF